jgi:hypothetical protein
MLVYVDESGDAGMKGKPGSSPFFVVAAVMFDDEDAAKACRCKIRDLHQSLNWGKRQEFKFNKTDHKTKSAFFKAISVSEFFYNAVVLNKAKLSGKGFQFKDPFYKYATSLVFKNAAPFLSSATVVMDQCGGREFRDQMQGYLKRQTQGRDKQSPIHRVRTEKSHACELVQLADMVVGAVARSFHLDMQNHSVYRAAIRHRELSVQLWPK